MCFDYGFGPFRWVCATGDPKDLAKTDAIACEVLEDIKQNSPEEIQQQMADNIQWIKGAQENQLVVGSQARILYADAEGRITIAKAFNKAIKRGEIGLVGVITGIEGGGAGLVVSGASCEVGWWCVALVGVGVSSPAKCIQQ